MAPVLAEICQSHQSDFNTTRIFLFWRLLTYPLLHWTPSGRIYKGVQKQKEILPRSPNLVMAEVLNPPGLSSRGGKTTLVLPDLWVQIQSWAT